MGEVRDRFPGVVEGVARFDGPAGTLMVDAAIEAVRSHLGDGSSANVGGPFDASLATTSLLDEARATVGTFLGAPAEGIVFGANMTTLTFAFTRAISRTWEPGDQIVCTQLDHDANVTPWVLAARDRGAEVVLAEVDADSGTLPLESVERCLTDRTRWLAVTGASNLLGTIPDLGPILAAARRVGARTFVDGVHLVPHRRVDVAALGCDVLATSPYKWYGPHAGVLAVEPGLLASIEPYKVRPAPAAGPRRLETGTPSFEAIAGTAAAARFLLEQGMDEVAAAERAVFEPLLSGLRSMPHVTVHGPTGHDDRTPTVLFGVAGRHPTEVAEALAREQVAVWSGDSYAMEAADAMGLRAGGVGVRAGVVRYCSPGDVDQLLRAVDAFG